MLPELLVVAACILLNSLLACLEMAFVSVSRAQVRQMAHGGDSRAKRLTALRDNPERTLSVIQIGITLVGAVSAAVGGVGAAETMAPWLMGRWGLSAHWAEVVAVLAVVVPLTYLNVVIGELVPKTVALKRPLWISLRAARWLALADVLLAPAVSLLEGSTKLLLRLFFPRLSPERGDTGITITAEDIDSLSEPHRQYLMNLAHLERKRVRDVMVPWSDAVWLDAAKTAAEVEVAFLASGHSRLPVLDHGKVIGFLFAKEYMALKAAGRDDWRAILRPVLVVGEGDSLLRVMRLLQARRSQLAIVCSPEKRLTGIVTLEDIIEEVVGEIYDEDDDGNLRRILASTGKLRGVRLPI